MSKIDKINELKEKLIEEQSKAVPDAKLITKIKRQILSLGIGLTAFDINNR
jgi:hypothetical protein